MARRAHNSKLPELPFEGRLFRSLSELLESLPDPPENKIVTIAGRLRKSASNGPLTEEIVEECLFASPKEYRRKYGSRITLIETDQGQQKADDLYTIFCAPSVSYSLFRQRLVSLAKRNRQVDDIGIQHAAMLSNADWITHYGGGRRKEFFYDGDQYPQHRGTYSSFTSFLKAIGRYGDRNLLNSRRKSNWEIDDLLREPAIDANQPGFIYAIIEKDTGKHYVGLTINHPNIRFNQHVHDAELGSDRPLHRAIRKRGKDTFQLKVIEEIPLTGVRHGSVDLKTREIFWIKKLKSLAPHGFNVSPGGEIGSYRGKRVIWNGKEFSSLQRMARTLASETGLPRHVILSRYRDGKPLPNKVRTQSKHPDAGSTLWRQWKGILKRASQDGVDEEWLEYDNFKSDISGIDQSEQQLTRRDIDRPWGPQNWILLSQQRVVERIHGKPFTAFGKTWPTRQAALDEYGVKRNVFDHRIKSGMSIEDALTSLLGPTSAKQFEFEGEIFKSRNYACTILSHRFGMTAHQVKDRLVRGIPISEWPISDR